MNKYKMRVAVNLDFKSGTIKIEDIYTTTNFAGVKFVADENEIVRTDVVEYSCEEIASAVNTLIQGKVLNGFDAELTTSEVAKLIVEEFQNRELAPKEEVAIKFNKNVSEELKEQIVDYVNTLNVSGEVVAKFWSKNGFSRIYLNQGFDSVGVINL